MKRSDNERPIAWRCVLGRVQRTLDGRSNNEWPDGSGGFDVGGTGPDEAIAVNK
jgi:hypothetical protein